MPQSVLASPLGFAVRGSPFQKGNNRIPRQLPRLKNIFQVLIDGVRRDPEAFRSSPTAAQQEQSTKTTEEGDGGFRNDSSRQGEGAFARAAAPSDHRVAFRYAVEGEPHIEVGFPGGHIGGVVSLIDNLAGEPRCPCRIVVAVFTHHCSASLAAGAHRKVDIVRELQPGSGLELEGGRADGGGDVGETPDFGRASAELCEARYGDVGQDGIRRGWQSRSGAGGRVGVAGGTGGIEHDRRLRAGDEGHEGKCGGEGGCGVVLCFHTFIADASCLPSPSKIINNIFP